MKYLIAATKEFVYQFTNLSKSTVLRHKVDKRSRAKLMDVYNLRPKQTTDKQSTSYAITASETSSALM